MKMPPLLIALPRWLLLWQFITAQGSHLTYVKCDGLPLLLVQRCWAAGLAELGAGCQLSCCLWEAFCLGRAEGLLSCFAEPGCSPCCRLMVGDAPVGLPLQVCWLLWEDISLMSCFSVGERQVFWMESGVSVCYVTWFLLNNLSLLYSHFWKVVVWCGFYCVFFAFRLGVSLWCSSIPVWGLQTGFLEATLGIYPMAVVLHMCCDLFALLLHL